MNPINPHATPAQPDIDHPSLFKEGKRVVLITSPLLAKKGSGVVTTRHGNNHTTPQKLHAGEK
jgi:hypothetical protein